jgi:hypothetical protein
MENIFFWKIQQESKERKWFESRHPTSWYSYSWEMSRVVFFIEKEEKNIQHETNGITWLKSDKAR